MIYDLIARIFYRVLNSKAYKVLVQNMAQYSVTQFKTFGSASEIPDNSLIKNPQYISIGKNFTALYNLRIEAWDAYQGDVFNPEIIIGDNVSMNTDCHIGCINKVVLGNNVMLASRIYISDHSHGKVEASELGTAPAERRLFSKGPVVIGDNVWIGEGVCILPGVTIGENTIVGANAVVTKSFPAGAVIGGNPARIIRMI